MSVKRMGFTLGMAALLGVTIWPGAASAGLATALAVPGAQAPSPEERSKALERYRSLPLSFIENQGQVDGPITYYLKGPSHSVYFGADALYLRLTQGRGEDAKAHTLKVELLDADPATRIEALEPAPGVVSYFKGPQADWKTAIPTAAKIAYRQPWPGIDLHYQGTVGRLEAVYTLAPHADPALIKLRYSGQASLALDPHGDLVVDTALGQIKESAPVLYQEIEGKRISVEGAFTLLDERTVGFAIAAYDRDHPLVIDPKLAYVPRIGGGEDDQGTAIAVDGAGNAYVTGWTNSSEVSFPVKVGPDLTQNGNTDAFVAKIKADGTGLVYAGFIGGSDDDLGFGIAVDSAGNAYVAGQTKSSQATFPVTVGPDLTHNGGNDAFVAKVNAAGTALVYAGYIGGSDDDVAYGIAVDSAGNAYVTGWTLSSEATFPVTVGPGLTQNGDFDAFVAKVKADGTGLLYAGYIGGSGYDVGNAIAVDSAGNAYVTGVTESTETTFPVTVGPGLTQNGGLDAFVAKVKADGTALLYAGYIGGSEDDFGNGIAVDSGGNAYVTGQTSSSEATFPVTVGPSLVFNGSTDAFVAKVKADGTTLLYAGYIGGSGDDSGFGIAVDGAGNAYVTGETTSSEATFPVTVGPGLTYKGGLDAFVAKVNAAGTALVYAGYIGGSGDDSGFGIAVSGAGNAYVTGSTDSSQATFPVTVGPDLTQNGGQDAFVAKVKADGTGLVYAGYIGGGVPAPVPDIQGSVAVGGAPLAGTKVLLKNLATRGKVKVTTDGAGAYQFDPVDPGSYTITIGTFVVNAPATVSGNLTVKGAPSVGTKVKIKNKNTGVVHKTTTDASGNFSSGESAGILKITITPVSVP